jgi:hypothetical protein
MTSFNYTVVGSTRVANKYRTAAAKAKDTYRIVYRWGQDTRAKLKGTPYPPPRPGQKYKRTGRLANSWAVRSAGKNTIQIVNNAATRGRPYARYVVGDGGGKGQAWMHAGRWWLGRDVISEEMPALREDLRQYIIGDFD